MTPVEFAAGDRTERRVALWAQMGLGLFGAGVMVLSFSDGHLMALVVGGLVALGGVIGGGLWRRAARPRRLVVEPQGLRWEDRKAAAWAVPWHVLSGVGFEPGDGGLWLVLRPADPQAFRDAHPTVPHSGAGWRVRLPADVQPEQLHLALRRHGRALYRG